MSNGYGNTAGPSPLDAYPYLPPDFTNWTEEQMYDYLYGPSMPATQSGLPYIPDVALPPQLQPVTQSGLPYIPDYDLTPNLQPLDYSYSPSGTPFLADYQLDPSLQTPSLSEFVAMSQAYGDDMSMYSKYAESPVKEPPSGPLEAIGEFAGNVFKGAGEVIGNVLEFGVNVLKFIFEHVEVSTGYQSGGGGAAKGSWSISSPFFNYEFPTGVSEDKTGSAEYQKLTAQGQATAPATTGPVSSNMLLYAAGGVVLLLVLKGK